MGPIPPPSAAGFGNHRAAGGPVPVKMVAPPPPPGQWPLARGLGQQQGPRPICRPAPARPAGSATHEGLCSDALDMLCISAHAASAAEGALEVGFFTRGAVGDHRTCLWGRIAAQPRQPHLAMAVQVSDVLQRSPKCTRSTAIESMTR